MFIKKTKLAENIFPHQIPREFFFSLNWTVKSMVMLDSAHVKSVASFLSDKTEICPYLELKLQQNCDLFWLPYKGQIKSQDLIFFL